MRPFNPILICDRLSTQGVSGGVSGSFARASAIWLGLALLALSPVGPLGLSSVASADEIEAGTLSSATPPTPGAVAVVSGVGASPGAARATRRSGFTTRPELYLGMTRGSERQKIEQIDPASWLEKFGDVRAVAVR